MLVTAADLWEPDPGTIVSWRIAPGPVPPRPVGLSLNQRNHLAAAVAGEPSVWLAATFDVEGPIDVDALEHAFRAVVARHSALQCGAAVVAHEVHGVRHDAASLGWSRVDYGPTVSVDTTRDLVRAELDRACFPLAYPAIWPAAISRADRSTIVLGLDHLHADAYSLVVLVDDLHALYDAAAGGRPAPDLPEAACFVSGLDRPPRRVPAQDDRLAAWHDFLRSREHRLPTFPIPLGVGPGERVAQCTEVAQLADADLTERVGAHSQRHGGTTSSAVLAALATAVDELGGPDTLAVLTPVHTRVTEQERRAVGWYTTTTPVELRAHRDGCLALTEAAPAVATGRAMAAVPLDQVLESASAALVRERADVFMASYLDYRRLPGHGELVGRRAHHVSAPTLADDLQVWISRTDSGLAVRVRLPDTTTARQVVAGLLTGWTTALRDLGVCARAGDAVVTAAASGRRESRPAGP
ncbi:condensation domain-containing protein [Aeromicrobium fastidiosum]|uniref:condensation domain-containing protein n=1 Tax=Aeromicrobium fastidiosum TaxID=52699 RepID=UPI00361769F2